jgi:replicative superfamily II helicase
MGIYIFQVAQFLRVNADTGLFNFDSSYRPVPLAQQYIGITERDYAKRNELFNSLCYEKVPFSLASKVSSGFRHLYRSFNTIKLIGCGVH